MKTYEDFRNEILHRIENEPNESDVGITFGKIEAMAAKEYADQQLAEYKEKLKNGLHSKTEWNYFELLDLIDETHH
jgi:hypothetical protein